MQQVLDSKDQAQAVTTGIIPVPAEVAADNALLRGEKPVSRETTAAVASDPTPIAADAADIEGDDGLTPRQKKDLTTKMQAAIGKKHRLLKDAEEFAAEQYNERRLAESRAEQFQKEINRLQTQIKGVPPVSAEPQEPQIANFETEEAYRNAVIDWKVEQRFKAREIEAGKQRETARQEQVRIDAGKRITKAMELMPDFKEITESSDAIVPPMMAAYMQESDLIAELGYHFAKHPDELERLSKMQPTQQLVALGKIEAIIKPFGKAPKANGSSDPSLNGSKPSTETVEPQSRPRAGAPITPISTVSAGQVTKPLGEMNIRETIADWSKSHKVRLTRRSRH